MHVATLNREYFILFHQVVPHALQVEATPGIEQQIRVQTKNLLFYIRSTVQPSAQSLDQLLLFQPA